VLFNGTADQIMPWPGGAIKRSKTLNTPGGDVVSATGTFDFWSRLDGCSESTIETLPGTHVSRYITKGCRSPANVSLYAIENGGHNWPGSAPQNGFESAIAGYVTTEISASVLLIQFFRNYGL
jgi:polyhydroxybutyrate depolymerase